MQQETSDTGSVHDDRAGRPRGDLEELSQLVGGMVERISSLRRRLDGLVSEADRRSGAGNAGSSTAGPDEVVGPPPPAQEDLPGEGPSIPSDSEDIEATDAPSLAAMNMSLSGSSREHTHEYLTASYPDLSEDSITEILDASFGRPDASQGRMRRFVRSRH